MPYVKPLPEWKNAGTKPPQSKIDAGWAIGDKPPAAWWNWWMYNTYYALQELQNSAVHIEKLGVVSGIATLGTDAKLTGAQLPAIGSAQVTDGSLTNTDLATDVKIGSLATLTTTSKASVTAAINEIKASDDLKIPLTQKGAANGVPTLDASTKIPIAQLPAIPMANLTDSSVTDAKLATDVKVGSLATLTTTVKGTVTAAINEVDGNFDTHNADNIRHVTQSDKDAWNAKASTAVATTSTNGLMSSIDKTKLDGVATGAQVNQNAFSNVKVGATIVAADGPTDTLELIAGTNITLIPNAVTDTVTITNSTPDATISASGLMTGTDKTKLNGISTGATKTMNSATNGNINIDGSEQIVYAHPATHPSSIIIQDTSNRFVSDLEKTDWNSRETTTGAQTKANTAETNAKNASFPRNDLRVTGADLNTYTMSGITAIGASATNVPPGFAFGNLLVAASATDRITQLAFDPGNKDLWIRFGTGTPLVWAPWIDFATTAAVTTTVNGLMLASDKVKLDGIAVNANNYVHPSGDGNLHVPATGTTNLNKVLKAGSTVGSLSWGNVAYSELTGVPSTFAPSTHGHTISEVTGLQAALDGKSATTHTHADATTSTSGFMPSADKTKLNGISTGANKTTNSGTNGNIAIDGTQVTVYAHPTGDGNQHVPATGTTNLNKVLKAGATAGTNTWGSVAYSELTGVPTTFAPSAHTHVIADVTNLQTTLNGKIDSSTKGAANGVASLGADGKVLPSQLPTIVNAASDITITDAGNYFNGSNVEAGMQEIGQVLAGARTSIVTTAQQLGVM